MDYVSERLGKWISSAIVIVIGILCIVAGAKFGSGSFDPSAVDTVKAISLTLGITMIVVGSLSLCLSLIVMLVTKGRGFVTVAIPGAFLLAVGISLVVHKYAFDLIMIIIRIVPFLLLTLGAVVLLDACFTLVRAIKEKKVKAALFAIIFAFLLAVGSIVLGALCVGDNPVIKENVQLIVFVIIVTLSGLLSLLSTFVKVNKVVVVAKKE